MPVSTRLNWGSRPKAIFSLSDAGSESSSKSEPRTKEQKAIPTAFSDDDIDQLLLKMGIKPEDNLRLAARFLIQHHFNLNRPLLEKAQQLLPAGPWENHGPAEALIAALSRCSLEDVETGFRILMSTFDSKHPTVMTLIQHILVQLQDLASNWIVEPENGINPSLMVDGLDEEILLWKSILESPQLQLRLMIQRGELLAQLRRLHLFIKLSLEILQAQGSGDDKPIMKQMRSISRDLKHAVELLCGDMVLSKQDNEHHFRESGQCTTLGFWAEGAKLPCRIWVEHDDLEEGEGAERAWSFRLHWVDEFLQHLECEVQIYKEECDLQFQGESVDTRQLLDEHQEALAAKLRALGYHPTLGLAKNFVAKMADPQAELHTTHLIEFKHVDSEA